MKKFIIILFVSIALFNITGNANHPSKELEALVLKLEKISKQDDYIKLADEFKKVTENEKSNWLAFYYTALCNAKVAWLRIESDPENIEPFSSKASEFAKQALTMIDTAAQRKEASEIYAVLSMAYRAYVYINPMTYGREYGTAAGRYTQLARKFNPENPRALFMEGWEKYATPKAYGGNKAKAKELLESARQKLSLNTSIGIAPHWGKTEIEDLLRKI